MLRTDDPDEQELWDEVRRESFTVLEELMTVFARRLIKEYSDAQERGKKRPRK